MTAPNTTWIWLYMLPVKQTTDRIAEWHIIEKEGMLLRERLEFSWKECFNFAIKAKPNTMKICILSKPVIFCAIWSTLSVAVYGQQDKITLQRGARPYIDYTKISPGDILPGTIRIRLDDDFSGLQAEDVTTGSDGCIRFGIPALDALNREAGVTGAKPVFFIALRNQRFHERHQLWGLELWYDLHISRESNTLELMSRYAALPEIASAEVLVKATLASAGTAKTVDWIPQDSLYLQQWDFNNTGQTGGTPGCDIHMSDAWEIERGDTGIVVAIMDQGVAYEHPDLQANMWEGIGYNFYADTTLIEPCLHGTHVAGTISANTNNGIGVSGIAGGDGTGNGVRIMSCQIISADNTVVEENIPNAFIWAADQGASISQNSWNLPTASPALLEAIDYFIANGGGGVLNGGILICSAGNSDTNAISYPACYEPCIAVAATSHNDIRSFYSNYGPWVSLSAPGGNYYPFNEEDILSTMPGDTYGYLMGTSMACPHVSGAAALIVSLTKGILVPEEVKDILLYSTDDISQLNPQYNGMLGTGRLNAYKALLMAQGYLNPDIPKPVISLTATNGGPGA
ncbi:MAG: S8 family serine peptidase, partial [Bacteroidales bacterium]|nr:S8 family serine peptidase [Bacteroidales bacterium]